MKQVIVQYRVKSDKGDENAALIREVFAQLHEERPTGLRYASYRGEDGVTFIHVASIASDGPNPLTETAAFKRFQRDIKARCDEPPVAKSVEVVGAYDALDPAS